MWKIVSVLSLFTCFYVSANSSVDVSVYYETLCPDSVRFINMQLYPTYKELGEDAINVYFVPYGHASETNQSGKWEFTCQHGPRECFGNAYHSCVIGLNPNLKAVTEFVQCSMSAGDPSSIDVLEKCAISSDIYWDGVKRCYDSGQYADLLIVNGERTRAVEDTSFIPTIVLNNKFDRVNQNRALTDFKGLICDTLNNEPVGCQQEIIQGMEVIMV